MLITVVTSNWGQIYELKSQFQRKTIFFDSTVMRVSCAFIDERMEKSRR